MHTGLPKKLLIKPGCRLLVLNAPAGFMAENLADLPDGATVTETAAGEGFEAVLAFAATAGELAEWLPRALAAVKPDGLVWVGFLKGTSKRQTDLTRDRGWEAAKAAGVELVSLVSLDGAWSGARMRPIGGRKPQG